ncbi:T6SS immunity protein Tdi1 domain-containing protein [Kutzneria chonburiensis]|uniref:T6SS immunity protein Tdi1 domain-containing protein n=1 Tax=Kutzneria chonburiensis TaxID=1483604 RepID=A0ABV6MYL2_9PSEU|nr:T6SS immunity protein Tdi1 domain-containing protein [Kutzneria chonburiensis]
MYREFVSHYPPDSTGMTVSSSDPRLAALEGFAELAAIGAGASFGNGIVRVHSEGEMRRAQSLIKEAFPEYTNRILPVAKDWLGRQYAGLLDEEAGMVSQLLLIEPGSGDAFEIDCGIATLFDVEFVADPVTYLATDLFAEWTIDHPETPKSGDCVGFKVPLFLGGAGAVDNLEVTDEEVYWSIFGQLKAKTRDLPPGTGIGGVQID